MLDQVESQLPPIVSDGRRRPRHWRCSSLEPWGGSFLPAGSERFRGAPGCRRLVRVRNLGRRFPSRTATTSRVHGVVAAAIYRSATGRHNGCRRSLQAPCEAGRWRNGANAGYGRKPGSLSSAGQAKAGSGFFFVVSVAGAAVPVQRRHHRRRHDLLACNLVHGLMLRAARTLLALARFWRRGAWRPFCLPIGICQLSKSSAKIASGCANAQL
jgi:hypothetical protein